MRIILAVVVASVSLSACGGVGSGLIPSAGSNPAATEASLEARLSQQGGSAETFAGLAAVKLELKQLGAARGFVRRALSLDPEHVGALVVAARIAAAEQRYDAAVASYRRAVAVRPEVKGAVEDEWGDVLLGRAAAGLERGHTKALSDALATLETELPGRADDAEERRAQLYLGLAELLLVRGKAEPASKAAAKARGLGADPVALSWVTARIDALGDAGEAARRQFEAWAAGGPPGREAARWRQVGDFYAAATRYDGADWAYGKAVAAAPNDPAVRRRLAAIALKNQSPDDAVRAWKEVVRLEAPAGDSAAQAKLLAEGGDLVRMQGYRQQALDLFSAATALGPADWAVVEARGDYLIHVGAWDDLAALVNQHIGASSDEVAAVLRGAKLLAKSAQRADAAKLLEGALGKHPGRIDLMLALADVRDKQGDRPARDAVLAKALQRPSTDPELLVQVGRGYFKSRAITQAQELAERAYREGGRLDAALLLADCLRVRARHREAHDVIKDYMEKSKQKPQDALVVGEWFAPLAAQLATQWLNKALDAKDPALRRRAHRALFELHQQGPERNQSAAGLHMRRWLTLTTGEERVAALDELLGRTYGVSELEPLRIEVLTELVKLRPHDGKVVESLGRLLLRQGEPDRAREMLERFVGMAERTDLAAARVGRLFLASNREDDALHFFEMVDVATIDSSKVHEELGHLYLRRGEHAKARPHFRSVIELHVAGKVSSTSPMRSFGRRMLDKRVEDVAVEAFLVVLNKEPKDQAARLDIAKALIRLSEVDQARAHLQKYLDQQSGSRRLRALDQVAQLYEREGALSDAALILEEHLAHERPRDRTRTFDRLAQLHRRMGDKAGILRAARLLLKNAGDANGAHAVVATELDKSGLAVEAHQLLTKQLAQTPVKRRNRDRLLLAAAANALARQQPAEAADLFAEWVKHRGDRVSDWKQAADSMANAGFPREAAALLEGPLQDPAAPPELFVTRGRLLLAMGDVDAAHQHFIGALMASLTPSKVVQEIERIYRQAGQLERLGDIQARVVALSPARSKHLLALGKLQLSRGELDQARQSLAQYLGRNDRGHMEVAKAYREAGYLERALEHFQRAYDQPSKGHAATALREVADILRTMGRLDELDQHVRRFTATAKDELEAYETVAKVWERAGQPQRAVEWLVRAARTAPDVKRIWELATLLDALGSHDEARAAFERYVVALLAGHGATAQRRRQDADETPQAKALREVVEHYVAADRPGEAVRFAQTMRSHYGDTGSVVVSEAHARVRAGDVRGAMALVVQHKRILAEAPHGQVRRLMQALADRRRLEEALSVAEARLLGSKVDSHFSNLHLALLARAGRVEEVERAMAELISTKGNEAHAQIGQILFQEGLLGLAETHLQLALERGPSRDHADAAFMLHQVAQQRGKLSPTTTLTVLGMAKREGENAVARQLLRAKLAFDRGRYAAALGSAEQVLGLEPANQTAFRLGIRAAAIGDDAAAVERVLNAYHPTAGIRRDVLLQGLNLLQKIRHRGLALDLVERLLALDVTNKQLRRDALRLALTSGEVDRARTHADAYVALHQGSNVALLDVAEDLDARLYVAEARRYLDMLKDPNDGALARREQLRARAALREGDAAGARAALDEAVKRTHDGASGRLAGAALADGSGVGGELVLGLLDPLLKRGAAAGRALALAAVAAWRAGDLDMARDFAQRLMKRFPRAPAVLAYGTLRSLARAAIAAGDAKGAQAVLDRIADTPGSGKDPLRYAAQVAATALDDYGASLPEPKRAAVVAMAHGLLGRVAPNAASGQPWLASARSAVSAVNGDRAGAIRAFEAAIRQAPHEPSNLNNLAYELAGYGQQLQRSLELVRAAQAHSGRVHASYLDTEAWILHRMGKSRQALPIARRALHLADDVRHQSDEDVVEVLYHLAVIERAVGLQAAAANSFRDCAASAPLTRFGALCLQELRTAGPK